MEAETLAHELFIQLNELFNATGGADQSHVGDSVLGAAREVNDAGVYLKDAETQTTAGYACHQCTDKIYASLKRHMDSQHSDVRYACLGCKATYSRRSDLKKHIKKYHEK